MAKNRRQREPLPEEFRTIEEAAEFWDTHSLADYEDVQKDVEFEVELKLEKNYFAIEKELSERIDNLAHLKGVLPETLVQCFAGNYTGVFCPSPFALSVSKRSLCPSTRSGRTVYNYLRNAALVNLWLKEKVLEIEKAS